MLKILDLFSGIGGFSYGLESTGGFETKAFCEIEPFCQKILNKHWPEVPIHSDIKETDFEQYKGTIDVITGGYPCQPFSLAGQQRGEEDPRHLWPRMREIIEQVRPSWVLCENVYGHVKLGLDKVLLDLENLGYTTRTFIVPACGVNAPHRRDRLWIVSYSQHNGSSSCQKQGENNENARKGAKREDGSKQSQGVYSPSIMANTNGERLEVRQSTGDSEKQEESGQRQGVGFERHCISDPKATGGWFTDFAHKPGICRVADGIPNRVDRIKSLGNAVVPQIVFNIGKAILYAEEKTA